MWLCARRECHTAARRVYHGSQEAADRHQARLDEAKKEYRRHGRQKPEPVHYEPDPNQD